MKRILIFSLNYYPRFIGGAEVALREITDRLPASKFEFHMITLRIDASLPVVEKLGNVTVHRIGFTAINPSIGDLKKFPLHLNKLYFQIGAYKEAIKLHKKIQFDIVWAMMAHSCAIPAGLFKKRFPQVKYLLTLQEGDPPKYIENMMRPMWPLFRLGFTSADMLQPISSFLQRWGMRMGFSGISKVIPNGVNVEKFSYPYSKEQIAKMKEKLGKKEGEIFIVTTSRLVYKNGVDDVIQAVSLLPHNISFLIYGIGPEEGKLRTLVKELDINTQVKFMGEIGHNEMPLMLQACDIFIRPSRSEGMGNSFIEAMAAGLPVIATQEGGIADFLFDERRNPEKQMTGWAVDVNSPHQIAQTIQNILSHPKKVEEVRTAAKTFVEKDYDWDTVADSMKKFFEQMTVKC